MGSDGIRPSSYFFFLGLRFVYWRGHVGGIRGANPFFENSKHNSPRTYTD